MGHLDRITRSRDSFALVPCVYNVWATSKKCTSKTKFHEDNNSGNHETWVVIRFIHAYVSAAKPRKVDGDEREKLRGHTPLSPAEHFTQNGHGLSSGEPFGPRSISKEMIGGNPTTSVPSSIFQPWFRMTLVNFSNNLSTSLYAARM